MKKNGFTVVEFLIVAAIVGILAAIAVPQYNKYKAQDRNPGQSKVVGGGPYDPKDVCVGGYSFAYQHNEWGAQILDENGRGIRCSLDQRFK